MSDKNDNEDLISVFVDGEELKVPPGTNMIEVAAQAGKEVPHYCYHPKLSISGNCRMCLVEMGMPGRDRATGQPMLNEDGSPRIMWMPKPAIACATNAAPGMHIKTQSPLVKECREGVMEFLLVNHPLDCPICDQAGECTLQEFATDYGRGYSRFVENKVVKPKRTRLGPRVMLDDERCILCSRCIRFSKEIPGDDVLGFIDRGSYSTLTCFPGKQLENNYSLNTVDICPVGALTSTDFRFRMRVWFLRETKSICTESSAGTNTLIGSREGKIYRITPRRNDAVNDTWMTDSGRALYKQVEVESRLTECRLGGESADLDGALEKAAELIKAGNVVVVGSGRSSVEEQWLTAKLAEAVDASTAILGRVGEGDGLLLTADRNPNTRGALLTGLISDLPTNALSDLAKAIDSGKVKTVVTVNEDLTDAGLTHDQLAKVEVIYIGTHGNATSEAAAVTIPVLTVFEKAGSFVNQQFRLQKFASAVPGPAGVVDDIEILARLNGLVRDERATGHNPQQIWELLQDEVAEFAGLAFDTIPDDGLPLDATRFSSLDFPEGKGLHYDPKPEPVAAV